MKEALTAIGLSLIVGAVIIGLIIYALRGTKSDRERKKQIEYELDHPTFPIEQEYHVRVSDMKCGTVMTGSSKHPVSQKKVYAVFDIIDDEGEVIGEPITIDIDEDTYLSLQVGMTGHIALAEDVFLGFIPESTENE